MQAFMLNFAAKEKIGEVKKVLQKAADTNKRKLPELDITPQVRCLQRCFIYIFWIYRWMLPAPLHLTSSTPSPSSSAPW